MSCCFVSVYVYVFFCVFGTCPPPLDTCHPRPRVPRRPHPMVRSIGGAVLVNPWNTTELTEQMIGAINMEATEREIR